MFRRLLAGLSYQIPSSYFAAYEANSSNTTAYGIQIGPSERVYSLSRDGGSDPVIVSLDESGAVLDAIEIDGASAISLHSAAVIAGELYVCGSDGAATDGRFVIKLPAGLSASSWHKEINDSSSSVRECKGIVESGSNIVVSGTSNGGVIGTGDTLLTALSQSGGGLAWHAYVGKSGANTQSQDMSSDSSGNIILTTTETITRAALNTMKFNSSGTLQWQRTLENASVNFLSFSYSTVDASGNVISLVRSAHTDVESHLVKYNSSGSIQWQRRVYQSGVGHFPGGVCCSSSGAIYISGFTSGTATNRVFVAKFSSSGSLEYISEFYHTSETVNLLTTTSGCIKTDGVSLYVSVAGTTAHPSLGYLFTGVLKIPVDGADAGSYGVWTYGSSSASAGTASNSDAAGGLSTSTSSVTVGNISRTETTPTISQDLVDLS